MRRRWAKYVVTRRTMWLGLATLAACCVAALIGGGYAERPEIAAIALGSLVVIAILSPGGALGAVILALPTAYTLHPFPVGSFSLLEVGIMCLAAGVGTTVLRSGWRSIRAAWRAWSDHLPVTLPAAAIIAAAGIAFATLPRDAQRDVALREIRVTLMEPLILFGVALLVMRDPLSRRWAWVCAVTIGAVIGTGAGVQVLGGFGGVESGVLTRATGIYSHPNNLALFLERTLLLSLPMLLVRPRYPLLWLAAGLQLAGIVLTFSRGALVAVCVGVGVLFLLLGMRGWLKAGVAVALGAGVVLFAVSRERLLDMGGSGSEPTRFAIWRSSLRMLLDHPLVGVGPDQFLYQYGRRYIEPGAWPERYTSHPHNLMLDVWLRLGAAGAGVFAALLLGVWRFVWRLRETIRHDAIACGAVAALAGGLAHGLLDNGFFLPDLAATTWVAIALVLTVDVPSSLGIESEMDVGER